MLGVIKSLHGGGAYVSDLDARTLLAPLDFYLSLTKANFADAFDSRRVIEIEIARRAAARATPADIQDLRDIIEAHKTVQDDPVGFRILDTRFHEKLSEIAGNAVLQRIAYGLYNLGLDFQNFDRRARNEPGLIAQSTADHIKIAAGITTRIPDRAADAMSEHIRNIELSTQRVLSSPEVPRSMERAQRMSRRRGGGTRLPQAYGGAPNAGLEINIIRFRDSARQFGQHRCAKSVTYRFSVNLSDAACETCLQANRPGKLERRRKSYAKRRPARKDGFGDRLKRPSL